MSTENIQPTGQAKAEALSSAAVARRRMLLKGLGKGSAVLAAAVPLQTLASQSVFTNPGKDGALAIRCGISGMTSGIHSRDTVTTVCTGYSPGYYKNHAWPADINRDAPCTTVCKDSQLKTYVCTETKTHQGTTTTTTFRSGTDVTNSNNGKTCKPVAVPSTLFDVIDFHESSDEYHWICAWLNGMGGAPASWNFPYTGAQVIAFYNGTGPGGHTKAQALAFFRTYMEIHT